MTFRLSEVATALSTHEKLEALRYRERIRGLYL